MDWERIDSTVRELFRKNGKEIDVHRGGTPLTDLIAKDPVPELDEMTELQLCEFAALNHIAIGEGLDRFEIIDAIKEALEKNWEERLKGMRGMMDYIAKDGPHPLAIVRNFCGLAKAVRPKCVLNASLAQLAVICDDGKGVRKGDGRATVSARVERLFSEPIRKAGMHGYKSAFQKTETACGSYSDAAQDNQNRLGRDFLQIANSTNGQNGHHKKKN
jgi:hypothetical protein